uniref:protocadherin beta-16-like isoform X2 n=1 Tax=Ciona intestinalis TaxID=7719 RepID=UPI00089DBB8E|nr:protocadherin beta-16-like isoform X2 [Ciona intestinalis]|eukprot:XP_018668990.1 protocadherin beta-16-like isoform X2 [Ciona intestinalis]
MRIGIFMLFNILCGLCIADKPIVKRIPEESPRGTKVADLRQEIGVSFHGYPNVMFRVMEQSLEFGTSRPSVTAQSNWVKVNARSGLMTVQDRIDREELCGELISCELVVKVLMLPRPNFRFITVRVNIDDVNDNSPMFTSPVINLNVSESTAPGHQLNLDRFQATDADLGNNSKIWYSLSQTENYFRINYYEVNGVSRLRLVLGNQLDFETTRVHRMVLTAHDSGALSRSSDVEVKIHVMDENDNYPIFEQKSYDANLRENDPPGHVIVQVQATDNDSGRRGIVRYLIGGENGDVDKSKSSIKWPVTINPDNGFVTLREKLDHKRHDGLKILIEAIDGDPLRPKKSKVILRLHVEDVNDNAPVITINYIVNNVDDTAYVIESAPIGTFIGHVSATDADEGPNSDVTMKAETIIPGTEEIGNLTEPGNFAITTENLLATDILLDREVKSTYDVIITACDNGSPAQCSRRTVRVVLLDVNEFTPSFQHPDFDLILPEDTPIGSVIAHASAVDGDSENSPAWRLNEDNKIEPSTNGKVTYGLSLAKVGEKSRGKIPIRINHESGQVTLVRSLDFETRKHWKFVITARDGGSVRRQSTRVLNITVIDVNDNRPIFTFPETSNTTVFASVTSRTPIFAEIQAVDFDTGTSTNIRYSYRITHKDGGKVRHKQFSSLFHLNAVTGQFITKFKSLDTQNLLGRYTVTISAKDQGIPPMTSTIKLYINVINGEPPPGYVQKPSSHGIQNDATPFSSTPFLLATILGGVLVLFLIIIVAACLVRKRSRERTKRKKEKEASSPSIQTTATPNDDETTSLTRPDLKLKLNSPSDSRRETESTNHWSQHTASTRLTSVSSTPEQQCRLCDGPTTPGSMQRYIGSQRPRYPSLPRRFNPAEHTLYVDMRDPRTHSEDYALPEMPMEMMAMGDKCTELCKTYGHCDTCWMPSSDEPNSK